MDFDRLDNYTSYEAKGMEFAQFCFFFLCGEPFTRNMIKFSSSFM
jgi:hypothetical protein